MSTFNAGQIDEARTLLAKHFARTRLQPASSVSRLTGRSVSLKIESELPTGSFKVRGALYALAVNSRRAKIAEVVTASTGNHGAAVAYAAAQLHIPCTVYLPLNPNPTKRARVVELGARVEEVGANLSEAAAQAAAHAERSGAYFLNDATDPDLPAGPATIAWEILEQRPDTDAILVPVGDTALIRGIAAAVRQLRPKVRIIGVQAEGASAYYRSWKAGKVVAPSAGTTIADGLAPQAPLANNVEQIRLLLDDFCLVSDDEMLCTMRHLILSEHLLSEPAGAAATAALIYRESFDLGRTPTSIVSGANVSPQVLDLMCRKSDAGPVNS
jgi:threonine dehydratase